MKQRLYIWNEPTARLADALKGGTSCNPMPWRSYLNLSASHSVKRNAKQTKMLTLTQQPIHQNEQIQEDGVFDGTSEDGLGRAGFKDVYTVEDANRELVFNVINNVIDYPKFLKIYSKTQILSDTVDPDDSNRRIRIARYDIAVPFMLKMFFPSLHYTLKLTSTFDEATRTESMWWEQVEGPSFLVENVGRWDVQEDGTDVKIYLEMSMGYSFYLPSHLKKYIMSYVLKDSMHNIQKRVLDVLGRKH